MKKENSTLARKLKAYSAMAGSVIAFAGTAQAQAFYTDIDPDVTVNENGMNYLLDLNNDGTNDFRFQFVVATGTSNGYNYSYRGIFAKPYNGGSIAGSASGARIYDSALDMGQTIDAALPWHPGGSQTMASVKWNVDAGTSALVYGKFYGAEDKYIPLRFKISNVKHYGWARFDVTSDITAFTIKDYAYNTVDNAGLLAGQGDPTSVQPVPMAPSVKVFEYDGTLSAILINQQLNNATLVITNMMGQQVRAVTLTHELTRVDVSDLEFGIYAVTVTNDGNSYSSKVALRR